MEHRQESRNYQFFCHTACEYFPCHPTDHPEDFNCLFCYCPLYALGPDCGGSFRYTESGRKDCSNCMVPHRRENYGYIVGKYSQIEALMKERAEAKAETSPSPAEHTEQN